MDFQVGTGSEATESELPALRQLVAMGYEYKSRDDLKRTRRDFREVLLYDRLEKTIRHLNPELDEDAIQDALAQIGEYTYPYNLDIVETNEKIRAKLVELSISGGLNPIVVTQKTDSGPDKKIVKIFDFDNPQNNDFLVTNQFNLDGLKQPICPDIVIFVNGIPLVVIECKSPTTPDPIVEAVEKKNFNKYQQRGKGYERLFFYNHCLIVICGILARVGTVCASANHFAKWTSSHQLSDAELTSICDRTPREQEILIAGLLTKKNLLEHLQNFVLYDTKNGKRVKMIAKHQQFHAVMQCVERLHSVTENKGGVIWHTQGSGKSFSMLWFATQLMYKFDNPPILIITDRKQLDKQIHDTFQKCGFPDPIKARSGKHLAELLRNPRGKTIMTVLYKFATPTKAFTEEKVICLVDEAHRSQYKISAEQMRVAMPNAVFYAFTGTPVTKNEKRNTYRVFGPLLDKYRFKESQEDGSTLPIDYEGRMPQLYVEGSDTIDKIFEKVFHDLDQDLKDTLKKLYVTKESIANAPHRIRQIVRDLVNHYTQHIEPNGYKAMLVAPSREAAVTYKKEIDKINGPCSKIIMTSSLGQSGKDGSNWDEYYLSDRQQELESEKFKNPNDPTKILIVVDMLLVGYDVPICQVLYLDRGIREHNLLQAIARVNRPYDGAKRRGLIVDYSGITRDLQKALDVFENHDTKGALTPIGVLIQILSQRHADLMSIFDGIDVKNHADIIVRFKSAHERDSFEHKFRMFSSALDSILPGREAEPYMNDFKTVSIIRQIVRTYYNDRTSTYQYSKKIQKIIDDHIRSLGISVLIDPMEITHENFLIFVKKKIPTNKYAQAALIKNRARQVIEELMPNNPAYYEKLYERLQRLIQNEKDRRQKNADYFTNPEDYEKIYQEALSEEQERKKIFGHYTATQFEFSLYGRLNQTCDKQISIDLAKDIFKNIKPLTNIVDYEKNSNVEKEIQRIAYESLKPYMDYESIKNITSEIMLLVRNGL